MLLLLPRPVLAALVTLVVCCGVSGAIRAQSPSAPDTNDDPLLWPEAERAFFQDGPGLLLNSDGRQRFVAADDRGRDAFLHDFLSHDGLKTAADRRQRLARSEYLSPRDVRAQLLFLNGPPAEKKSIDCGTAFKPIEIWTYRVDGPVDPKIGKAEPKLGRAVVYQSAPDEPFRYWNPIDGKRSLYTPRMGAWLEDWEEINASWSVERFDLQICKEAKLVDQATGVPGLTGGAHSRREKKQIASIAASGYGIRPWTTGAEREGFLEPPKDLARWAREAAETKLPQTAVPAVLTISPVEVRFPERAGQRMLAQAIVRVTPDEHVKVTDDEGKKRVSFIVEGVLEHEGRIFDEFRVRYKLPAQKDPIDLSIDRELRADQTFLLRLKVRDESGGAEAVTAKGFRVPREPVAPPPTERATAAAAKKGETLGPAVSSGTDTLTLIPPESDVIVGLFRAEALLTGRRITKVVFFVDGKQQLVRNSPPFSAELRLAEFPTEQLVKAEGYDETGKLLASDEVVLNEPRGVFKVTILAPPKGGGKKEAKEKVAAKAGISVPEERRVESVEFKVNDKPVVTLTRPPWEASLSLPGDPTVYLTVSAKLDDGQTAEDTRFLRSAEYVEEVDVDLVELYTAVTDGSGNLVRGLTEQDFQVLEGGKPQKLTKFELVENLPLTVGIAIDTSGSMSSSLAEAERAAAGFLTKVVKPKDQCFALTFSGRPVLRMPLSDDVEAVGRSLEGLQAVGATAMHDAIVHALYYFRGTHGQKVLVLLSDGDDTSSEISFKDALEYAKRSGVAIYTIGLNVPVLATGIRSKLNNLAAETGGQTYFVSKASELASIYEKIGSELRSRYLLAFNAERKPGDKSYRPVDVKVLKRGLKARTAHGYYP